MELRRLLESDKTVRTVGFDDQPFDRDQSDPVGVAGVVCKGTSFDGMVWTRVTPDGADANRRLAEALAESKFLDQLHAVLLDGIAFAGFNVVDLPALAETLDRPCVTVMRRRPDFDAIREALRHVDRPDERMRTIRRAGDVHAADDVFFQSAGCSSATARTLVDRLGVRGYIPEPIRIAHQIATAVADGESGRRA